MITSLNVIMYVCVWGCPTLSRGEGVGVTSKAMLTLVVFPRSCAICLTDRVLTLRPRLLLFLLEFRTLCLKVPLSNRLL